MTRATIARPRPEPAMYGVDDLLRIKGEHRISVCIPARNEERTVGGIVRSLYSRLVRESHLVDELIVLDHDSADRTATVAARAGATVVGVDDVLPEFGPALGKGDVLWRSLAVATGDIVLWCDADLRAFDPLRFIGLAGPLLADRGVAFVKGTGVRVHRGVHGEGGRVTELVARPVLELLHPSAGHIRQPLLGEYGGRTEALRALAFEVDYGVEIGLLIDAVDTFGPHAVAEVNTGPRVHRSRSLADLGVQSRQVLRAALTRAGLSVGDDACRRPPLDLVLGTRPEPLSTTG